MRPIISFGGIAVLALFMITSCGENVRKSTQKNEPAHPGKVVYDSQCARCHGSNGKLGMGGAKDLSVSKLIPVEMITVISYGSSAGLMPAYKDMLSEDEINAVALYIETTLKN